MSRIANEIPEQLLREIAYDPESGIWGCLQMLKMHTLRT
jgi:hypothetical protein